MKRLAEQSEPLLVPSVEGDWAPVAEAGAVMMEFLTSTALHTRNHGGMVLAELGRHAAAASQGARSDPLSTAYLKQAIAPDAVKEPSAWMAPIWAKLLNDEPKWTEGFEEAAARLGKKFVPRLAKAQGHGNTSVYFLEAVPVSTESPCRQAEVPEGGVQYTTESTTESAAWLRWFFQAGVASWSLLTRMLVVVGLIAGLLLILFFFLVAYTKATQSARPLTFQDVWFLVTLGSLIWLLRAIATPFSELIDFRIIMAPTPILKFKDWGVTLEIRSTGHEDDQPRLMLAKYTAVCAECGGQLEVRAGGKSFPNRLVGRCNQAPREHVYSFDHVQRIGRRLL